MADMLLGGIVINEILVDPNGSLNFDTDGNGTAAATDEYIELYNSSNSAIDISGLELWDEGVGHWFTFPSGTILQPGAHAMVLSGVQSGGSLPSGAANDLFFDAGRGSALINNGGDNVTLYDPNNDEFVQATYNGDTLDNPVLGGSGYSGFSATATRVGLGEDFGTDTDGLSLQRQGDGEDSFVTDTPTPGVTNVCFSDGTFLDSPNGEIAIENLKPGDIIHTKDHGPLPITWTFSKTWTPADVARCPNLAAILIPVDTLSPGLPSRDLYVSQQHRVLVKGQIARRMFGTEEVLVPAKALLAITGVRIVQPTTNVTYYHVMFNQHEIVHSNGVATESLFLGKGAISSIPQPALLEICEILNIPRSQLGLRSGPVTPARTFVKGKKAARLIHRHTKNNRAISPPIS